MFLKDNSVNEYSDNRQEITRCCVCSVPMYSVLIIIAMSMTGLILYYLGAAVA